jgi:hypothetical protein
VKQSRVANLRLCFVYGNEFAERVIGNLCNTVSFCQACGHTCGYCRLKYGSFAENINGVYEFSDALPPLIEDPLELLPMNVPECDVLIAIGLHPDLLSALPLFAERAKVKAVIVPIEDGNWCSIYSRRHLSEALEEIGIEYAFPKPFCSLEGSGGPTLNEFVKQYQIGRPEVEVEVKLDSVIQAFVSRSAPCGSTWYVAQYIQGRRIPEIEDVVAVAHHSYPCTASMMVDSELNDTILHKAGYIIREAINKAVKRARR